MDYQTKPTSRADLRRCAPILRKLFGVPLTGPFPVLEALDRIPDVFEGSNYVIVEDKDLPAKTMAQCTVNDTGGMTVEIRQSVYDGAYRENSGACRGFICHELCHLFLFRIGFTPIHARSFADGEIRPCCSVEWQAKALCGEVMIPYDESRGMTQREIQVAYQVSKAFARYRYEQGLRENVNTH